MGRSTDSSSAYKAVAITKSDVTVLEKTRALYVGGAGDIAVRMAGDGSLVTFSAVPVGTLLPIQVDQVKNATTATLILALY